MNKPANQSAAQRTQLPHGNQAIVYIDMDDTLCDYQDGYRRMQARYPGLAYPQSVEGFFLGLEPMPGAIEAFRYLWNKDAFAVYILTAPSVINPHSYTEKRLWIERHLGLDVAYRLILCPNKGLLKGDILIDDHTHGKGQEHFNGTIMQFGSDRYPDWIAIAKAM